MATVFSTDTPYLFNVSFDVPDPETSALDEDEAVEPQLPTYSLEDVNSPLKKASLTGFHATAKHIAAKAVSPSSETMRTI